MKTLLIALAILIPINASANEYGHFDNIESELKFTAAEMNKQLPIRNSNGSILFNVTAIENVFIRNTWHDMPDGKIDEQRNKELINSYCSNYQLRRALDKGAIFKFVSWSNNWEQIASFNITERDCTSK